jgi:hypothetical protein
MGNWVMIVEGHGIHDNGKDEDADAMLRQFAVDLRTKGHVVSHVSITSGFGKRLSPPLSTAIGRSFDTDDVGSPVPHWQPAP